MKSLIFLPILLFVLGIGTSSVFACIGNEEEPFYIEDLVNVPILVLGTVLEVDDSGYNALIQVERYLIGEGMAQIVHSRHTYGLYAGSQIRGYDTGCVYDGGGASFTVGSRGYFGFYQGRFGTYSDGSSNDSQGIPHFLIEQNAISYISRETGVDVVSPEEFSTMLVHILGDRASNFIPTDQRRALLRPLLITTETGSQYQVNVNYSLSPLEATNRVTSPDGTHFAYFGEENQIILNDFWHGSQNGFEVRGTHAIFSPDSNFVVVWDAEQLHLLMFQNWNYSDFSGREVGFEEIAVLELDNLRQVLWGDDSSTIAFVDDSGIWQWNIFYSEAPSLVAAGEETLLDLSPTGRFLRYGTEEAWKLVNTDSGEIYDNAVATPDERNLIYINSYPDHLNSEILTPCHTPLPYHCPVTIGQEGEIRDYFWYKNDQIALLTCTDMECILDSHSWNISVHTELEVRIYLRLPLVEQIIYEEEYDFAAFVVGDYQVQIGLDFMEEHRTVLNLSSQLDSPITHIEWGQPIFYEEH